MKNRNLLILSMAGLLSFGAACGVKTSDTNSNTNDDDFAPVVINLSNDNVNGSDEEGDENDDENTNANTNTKSNSNSNTHTNSNTNTSANEDDAVSGTLSVSDPASGKDLESPFTVEGKSAADKVYVSVVSKTGVTIFTVPVIVREGVFKASITFDFSNTTDGAVKVFEKDAAGNITNEVSVSVTFKTDVNDDTDTNTNGNSNENDNTNTNDNENENSNTNTDDGY